MLIFLEFNLGPLFMLQGLVDRIFELKKREYIYRRKFSGGPSTHFSRLADSEEGASVSSYRKEQIASAHLPVNLWSN
jgi:hypothetical protein